MQNVCVLTGAGVSAESGLRTFRDSDGLWESYRIEDVATPEAWARDPQRVLAFYNERRRQVVGAQPNAAHQALARLEAYFHVDIVTQNIDDLHERAGSTQVLHVHGEILKARSTADGRMLYDTQGQDINVGDLCDLGSQLRPHVVWFGEEVPAFEAALERVSRADKFLVIGTSLAVFPVASLVRFVSPEADKVLISPEVDHPPPDFEWLRLPATQGVPLIVSRWIEALAHGT